MRLYELLQAYEFDEIMPVIVEMFPGTGKYEHPLRQAYDILVNMKPVASKKEIRYKILSAPNSDEQYMGAEDRDFDSTWEVCLGKNISRERGVDLTDIELVANTLVNICFIGRHPRSFDSAYAELTKPER
ncbi:MAG: hypothetical protein I3J02_02770 [Prevotella sp.]|nr:hypothetical protein [Prevotella sp.]